jgi:pimeloyl-ACP methyl ester carboxylesterase
VPRPAQVHLLVPDRAAGQVREGAGHAAAPGRGRRNTHAPRGTLLFLTGGPGQPGVRFVAPVAHELATAMGAYRLVMIDQRGTGGQAPRLP